MPVFQLTDELIFPPAELAERDGLLAIGGDLSPERLLLPTATASSPGFQKETQFSGGPPPHVLSSFLLNSKSQNGSPAWCAKKNIP